MRSNGGCHSPSLTSRSSPDRKSRAEAVVGMSTSSQYNVRSAIRSIRRSSSVSRSSQGGSGVVCRHPIRTKAIARMVLPSQAWANTSRSSPSPWP